MKVSLVMRRLAVWRRVKRSAKLVWKEISTLDIHSPRWEHEVEMVIWSVAYRHIPYDMPYIIATTEGSTWPHVRHLCPAHYQGPEFVPSSMQEEAWLCTFAAIRRAM